MFSTIFMFFHGLHGFHGFLWFFPLSCLNFVIEIVIVHLPSFPFRFSSSLLPVSYPSDLSPS